jgi:hypothetical protein
MCITRYGIIMRVWKYDNALCYLLRTTRNTHNDTYTTRNPIASITIPTSPRAVASAMTTPVISISTMAPAAMAIVVLMRVVYHGVSTISGAVVLLCVAFWC